MVSVSGLVRAGVRSLVDEGPVMAARRSANYLYQSGLKYSSVLRGAHTEGENVYDRDWDVLVVLDACRYDAMEQVMDEYGFLEDATLEEFHSVGSHSAEWYEHTFEGADAQAVQTTTLVSANYHAEHVDLERFNHVEPAWTYAYDDDRGAVRPRPVTEAAIYCAREEHQDRLIVHYMQPHFPFFDRPDIGRGLAYRDGFDPVTDLTPWMEILTGDADRDEVVSAYLDNLRLVLEEVDILRNNIDADPMVLTADHGNAVGDDYWIFGHPRGVAIEPLRTVPWVEIGARDTGERDVDIDRVRDTEGYDREEMLTALGYADEL